MTPLWVLCHVDCQYGEESDEHDLRCEPQVDLSNAQLSHLAEVADIVRPHHASVGGLTPQYLVVEVPRGYDEPTEPDVI